MLSKARIAEAITSRTTSVFLECFQGEEARIRIPNAAEARAYFGDHYNKLSSKVRAERHAKMIAECYCDESGEPIFTPDEVDQLPVPIYQELQEKLLDVMGLGKKEGEGN